MKEKVRTGLKIVVGIYLVLGGILYLFQNSLIYSTTKYEVHHYKEEIFEHKDATLRVLILNAGKNKAMIYFGGKGESMVTVAQNIQDKFSEYTVYLPNYRGYGGSSGSPSQEAFFSDALFIYDRIKKRHQSIDLIGRSLGTGVTVYLSTQRVVNKMALVTPYDSVRSIAQKRYPLYPMDFLLRDTYDVQSFIPDIKAKYRLILLAEDDKVIPAFHSDRLIENLPFKNLEVKTLMGTGHNSIATVVEYYEVLEGFFEKVSHER